MALIDAQDGTTGRELTFEPASSGGDTLLSGALLGGWLLPVVLIVRNSSALGREVTVNDEAPVTVGPGGVGWFPVTAPKLATLDELASVTYSVALDLEVAVVRGFRR